LISEAVDFRARGPGKIARAAGPPITPLICRVKPQIKSFLIFNRGLSDPKLLKRPGGCETSQKMLTKSHEYVFPSILPQDSGGKELWNSSGWTQKNELFCRGRRAQTLFSGDKVLSGLRGFFFFSSPSFFYQARRRTTPNPTIERPNKSRHPVRCQTGSGEECGEGAERPNMHPAAPSTQRTDGHVQIPNSFFTKEHVSMRRVITKRFQTESTLVTPPAVVVNQSFRISLFFMFIACFFLQRSKLTEVPKRTNFFCSVSIQCFSCFGQSRANVLYI